MTANNQSTTLSDNDISDLLKIKFKKSIIDSSIKSDLTFVIEPKILKDFIKFLKESRDLQFSTFIDICGVDYPNRPDRFDVVYHFLSLKKNKRIRVKLSIHENDSVESIVDIFPSADWYEREAYDLYGINFANHPDLRRMLTDYNFQGHPLRKDFPLTGYTQVRYDDTQKRVIHEPVELGHEFRDFDFESPWLGEIPSGNDKDIGEDD
ncbi:MAG: NADH-quinone oxidoreductase subunit C [Hyphomicrobiales bacterium]|nr:NADH-quinone oxidoreductase subunit C [Hyphomicrobiales bacterium]|tara:strand:- start:736 stop:1359 length:624 start_codon:yes stop_codon:yes gene_type:complete